MPPALHLPSHTFTQVGFAKAPRRINGLFGAARAAQKLGHRAQAVRLFRLRGALCSHKACDRPELGDLKTSLEHR